MEIVIVTIAFIVLVGFIMWLFVRHVRSLEVLLKAADLHEAKSFEKTGERAGLKREDEAASLVEMFEDKSPDEIRAAFGAKNDDKPIAKPQRTAQPVNEADEQSSI